MVKEGAGEDELRMFRKEVQSILRNRVEEDTVGAGQVCGMINEIKSAKDLIEEIMRDAKLICARLNQTVHPSMGKETGIQQKEQRR